MGEGPGGHDHGADGHGRVGRHAVLVQEAAVAYGEAGRAVRTWRGTQLACASADLIKRERASDEASAVHTA